MTRQQLDRFWSRVSKTSDCWEFTPTNSSGYGRIVVNGKRWLTHRLSWVVHFGEIPDNLCVCHKCDNPACVRPTHLFLGTQTDNLKDMDNKGRRGTNSAVIQGEQNGNVKLTDNQVSEVRRLYIAGKCNYIELAEKFDVHRTTISRIIRNKNRKEIK